MHNSAITRLVPRDGMAPLMLYSMAFLAHRIEKHVQWIRNSVKSKYIPQALFISEAGHYYCEEELLIYERNFASSYRPTMRMRGSELSANLFMEIRALREQIRRNGLGILSSHSVTDLVKILNTVYAAHNWRRRKEMIVSNNLDLL